MYPNGSEALYTISHGIPYRVQRLQQTGLSGIIYTLKYIVYVCIYCSPTEVHIDLHNVQTHTNKPSRLGEHA